MSLLLTRYVDQYGIDVRGCKRSGVGVQRLRAALLEPLANQILMETITLDDENALHERRLP